VRKPLLVAGALLVLIGGAACGRPLPEEGPVPTGPAETGAFEQPEAEGAVRGAGAPGAPHDYLQAVADTASELDPTLVVRVREAEPDFDALCAGELDVLAAEPNQELCEEAVGFYVAQGVSFYVNREALLQSFEVESLTLQAVDSGETLPQEVGLEPLSIDQLQETQTKLEQVIAGVG
jgi:hypothetical protein